MNETRLARSSKLLKLDDGYNKIYYPFSFYFCLSLKFYVMKRCLTMELSVLQSSELLATGLCSEPVGLQWGHESVFSLSSSGDSRYRPGLETSRPDDL